MIATTSKTKIGDIYWLNFSPTIGTEIKKIRPALIISSSTKRIIVLPITSWPLANSN